MLHPFAPPPPSLLVRRLLFFKHTLTGIRMTTLNNTPSPPSNVLLSGSACFHSFFWFKRLGGADGPWTPLVKAEGKHALEQIEISVSIFFTLTAPFRKLPKVRKRFYALGRILIFSTRLSGVRRYPVVSAMQISCAFVCVSADL